MLVGYSFRDEGYWKKEDCLPSPTRLRRTKWSCLNLKDTRHSSVFVGFVTPVEMFPTGSLDCFPWENAHCACAANLTYHVTLERWWHFVFDFARTNTPGTSVVVFSPPVSSSRGGILRTQQLSLPPSAFQSKFYVEKYFNCDVEHLWFCRNMCDLEYACLYVWNNCAVEMLWLIWNDLMQSN